MSDKEASSVYTATSIAELQASLCELSARDSAITTRLNTLLSSQNTLSAQLSRLDLARAHLTTHTLAARNLHHDLLLPASATATRISSSVKSLDTEQANVKSTLAVVESDAELKQCVLGVHGSMGAPQDWETAANYLHRASRIPADIIDSAFAEEMVPTAEVPDPPRVTLEAAAEALCGLFLREFEKAARDADGGRVTRFFKLFPLINRSDVGLEAYGRYVCSGIASRARTNMSSTTQRSGLFYANALTKLFEHIAQIVEGHAALVERHYGAGSMSKVIERIQVEADVQGGIILETWAEERNVGRKLTEVKSYPFNFLVHSFLPAQKSIAAGRASPRSGSPAPGRRSEEDSVVDMKEVDALLNESAVMLSRWSLYSRFLASKTSSASPEDEHNTTLTIPPFLTTSTLHAKISSNLLTAFNTLSTFSVRRSLERALQLDEPPADLSLNPSKPLRSSPPFITSAVDDTMYISSSLLMRTLSTTQRAAASSVLPTLGRVLGSDFFGIIQRRMRDECYPKPAVPGALPPEQLIISFILQMNNLDVATDYLARIVKTALAEPLDENWPFGHEAVYIRTLLTTLQSSFANKTADLLAEATEVLLKQVMRPRMRPVLAETFKETDYSRSAEDDGEDEEDEDDQRDLVAQRFARGWQALTLPLKRLMTPANYARLLALTCGVLARGLEKRILSYERVTALGAVRLERDFNGTIAAAVQGAGNSSYEVRDLFKKLEQMVLVLGMEEEEWESIRGVKDQVEVAKLTGVEWVLGREERERVRAVLR